MSSQPRIAIVGGGPAGLTLGVLLHKRGIQTTIFELRQEPTNQDLGKPSGVLDLHQDSGLAAIKECGLFDDFVPLTGECAETTTIANKDGQILFSKEGKQLSRPEISRNALNKLLINNLPTDVIKWDHKLFSAATSTTNGRTQTELDFGTHGKQTFDLVVGADGAWSRVRNLVTHEKPYYAGKHVITLTITHITDKYPHLAKLVGPGSFMALGNRHSVVSQRGSIDSARIYIFLTGADEHFATTSGLAGRPATTAKDKLLSSESLLGSWGTPIKELVATACNEEAAGNAGAGLDIRALYTQPIENTWEHKPGVTLIGDAAHLMLPSGEGVNLAMLDALLLSRTITKAYDMVAENDEDSFSFESIHDELLKGFEKDLAARGKKAAEDSRWLNDIMFGEDGARALVAAFQRFNA
ncbi:hypothetical protein VM1G_06264 [Cytospora mali]|uniref:FAD-binding domain-containing protein n=1 Tax=Cytospora mali TaxID=578113 RepID=A0A194W2X9_CYTMA|nr:hypothetical protein VM1G_06264 [Valsa mali]